jgi:hypothetical protein
MSLDKINQESYFKLELTRVQLGLYPHLFLLEASKYLNNDSNWRKLWLIAKTIRSGR